MSRKKVSNSSIHEHNFPVPCLEEPAADADDVTEPTSKRQARWLDGTTKLPASSGEKGAGM